MNGHQDPNIVIIMTDQQRADLRKSRGYALDTMPFLDSLGETGVDFDLAYTPCPTCMPARVSMFTGRYAQSHRVRTNHNREDAYYSADLLELLRARGYVTALCGKNHSHHPESDFDFAETCGHLGHEGNLPVPESREAFARFLDDTDHMETHSPLPGGVESQHPYQNVSSAFSFLNSTGTDKPFFLWLSFAEPHNPYQVPAPYYDLFPPEALPPLATSPTDADAKGHKFRWLRDVWEQTLGPDIDDRIGRARSNYHGMLRLIDDQLKRFVKGLEERNLRENTLLIFVSDHGDFVGEYGLIRKGPDLPEVLTRIPMLWSGPGVEPGGIDRRHCTNLVDILPTICDILGMETPVGVQGKSIRPLLRNRDIPEREFESAYSELGYGGLYWTQRDSLTLQSEGACRVNEMTGRPETLDCLNTWTQCGQIRMLRRGRWKLQADMMGNYYLYDLSEDPMEIRNLYGEPGYEAVKTELLEGLLEMVLKQSDDLPLPRYRYRLKRHPRGYWHEDYIEQEDPGAQSSSFST